MKFDITFLRRKVARRILMLFFVCALLPITLLAIISFNHVTKQLRGQSQRRLQQASKAAALSIYERLLFLEAGMKSVASTLTMGNGPLTQSSFRGLDEDLRRKFKGLVLVSDTGNHKAVFGEIENPPKTTGAESHHLSAGRIVVSSEHRPALPTRVFMKMMLDPQAPLQGVLLGEINTQYLWGSGYEDTLPPMTELYVLDQSANALISSLPGAESLSEEMKARVALSVSGQFEWRLKGAEFLAAYWSIPLKYRFFVPQWTVVLSEPKADVLAPVSNFKKTFLLVILLSLCTVLLLSISQIRRSLVPLQELQEGTRRIAQRDFGSRVAVTSGDEFEDLAASFNSMARRLSKQFDALATMAEIDRAVLSALDTEKILETVLNRIHDVFPCDRVTVTLFDQGRGVPRTYVKGSNVGSKTWVETFPITSEDVREVCAGPEGLLLMDHEAPRSLAPLFGLGVKSLLLLPISIRGRLSGIITLGHLHPPSYTQDDLVQAHQLVDQVAVAIHNAQLYEETKNQAIELEKSNKVKDEFLSVMSHELRTPLTTIIGFIEMIRDKMFGAINAEQEKALEKVMMHSKDLISMINGILYATLLESNAVKAEINDLKLDPFLEDLKSDYAIPLDKGLSINWDFAAGIPPIRTDAAKLKHVLQNVINNAIKFTETGNVAVSVRHFPEARTVEFKVADTGIGIPKEKLSLIFEKFYQVDSSQTRLYGGVGMGLYTVNKFTGLLGGTIEVESEAGKGSVFTVKIPY